MSSSPCPNPIVRPWSLVAIALLVVNDHVLKQAYPGFITGKVSDFAGLFFFPFFLYGLTLRRASLFACCVATALVFSAVKTIGVAHDVYCYGLGFLQWPFRGVFRPVKMTMDATDLCAVVSVVFAYRYAKRHDETLRSGRGNDWRGEDVARGVAGEAVRADAVLRA